MEELLRFQVQEIEQAGLSVDEEDRLSMERQRLSHAHRLRELAESSYAVLQEDERDSTVATVARFVSELVQTDPVMEERSPGSPRIIHERRDRSSARVCR